eukprot:6658980-Lingulodinium_polyedra.AAC.1
MAVTCLSAVAKFGPNRTNGGPRLPACDQHDFISLCARFICSSFGREWQQSGILPQTSSIWF